MRRLRWGLCVGRPPSPTPQLVSKPFMEAFQQPPPCRSVVFGGGRRLSATRPPLPIYLREVVLSDTAPGSDAVSPGPSLRSTLAGVEGGSPESPRAARGNMASRWENSFVLLTLSLEVQRPGCEPSPWLSRVGAASGLSGRLAHAQPACGCPDTWPLVDLARTLLSKVHFG